MLLISHWTFVQFARAQWVNVSPKFSLVQQNVQYVWPPSNWTSLNKTQLCWTNVQCCSVKMFSTFDLGLMILPKACGIGPVFSCDENWEVCWQKGRVSLLAAEFHYLITKSLWPSLKCKVVTAKILLDLTVSHTLIWAKPKLIAKTFMTL